MQHPEYTDREWNFLTHFGEYDWPENWNEQRDDRERWSTAVADIARRHGLSMTHEPEVGLGSNLACILDDAIIKIYARYNPIRFPREVEALQLLEHYPAAKTPRLIAHDDLEVQGVTHSYIVMERLPGRPFRSVWEEMTDDDRTDIIRQLVPVVRAVHDAPTESLTSFGSGVEEWIERMKRRAELAHALYAEEWPDSLLEQLDPLLEQLLPVLESTSSLHLLSGDVIGGNILVDRRDEKWELTGLIDFGDAEVGPLEYEWISVCQKACRRH
jgi:hygromycin-B 7''-O-kinase